MKPTTKLFTFLMLGLIISTMKYEVVHGQDVQQSVTQRTKESIVEKFQQYLPMEKNLYYMNSNKVFEKTPSYSAPYDEGKLKREYILDGINAVNWVRYLAGVPDDIQPDWSMERQEQAAALVNGLNDRLSHSPSRPAGIESTLFDLGYKGAGSSNLSAGRESLYASVISGYMPDNSESNIDRVGHRRWVINPMMTKTMFGYAFTDATSYYPYSSMYAFDRARNKSEVTYDYISWPSAGYFPQEVFATRDPWSVSLNVSKYDNKRTDHVQVTLTRVADGQTWNFSAADTDKNGKYFNVETSSYGIPYCIIFRPDHISGWKEDDRFKVEIHGIYNLNGQEAPISYETTLFNFMPQTSLKLQNVNMKTGDRINLRYTLSGTDQSADFLKPQFVSDTPDVATIDENNVITAHREGSAMISLNNYFDDTHTTIYVKVNKQDTNDQVSSWAKNDYFNAKSNGLIDNNFDNNYQKPITRQTFAISGLKVYESMIGAQTGLPKSPFKDVNDKRITYAYNLGLIKGTSSDMFSPKKTLTRQEVATLLVTIYEKVHAALKSASVVSSTKVAFNDDANISSWAKDSVYKAVHLGLMSGVSNNRFEPSQQVTTEQAYVSLQKLLDKLESE